MPAVQTLFADPRAIAVDGEYGTWILSGVATNRLRDIVVDADGVDAISQKLKSRTEDAVIVFIAPADAGGRVTAFRSATSSRDLFYLEGSDGTLVLSDHYRNAVAQLDRGDRHLDRDAVIDHLLFRSPVPPATLIEEIGRLGRGDVLTWDGTTGEWTRTVLDGLSPSKDYEPATAGDELDAALADTIQRGVRPDARTMLSGGIDSTLLASYRDDPPAPRQVVVDSPEFQAEVEAGRDAADMLGRSLETTTPETAFTDQLESAVDRLGLPPRYSRTVFTAAGFETWPSAQYVSGQAADALFGLQGVKAVRLAAWLGPLVSTGVADVVTAVTPTNIADAVTAIRSRREQLDRRLANPKSLAHALSTDVDAEAVASVFDAPVVRDRAQRRLSYALDRCQLEAETTFGRAVAAGHLLDFLDDDAVNQWRQLGFVHGHDVVAPFRTRRVVDTALAVPAEKRYIQGVEDIGQLSRKYIPKSVLADRVPEYPIHQPKGNGTLPLQRYHSTGPLASVFDQYEPPTFLGDDAVSRHVTAYGSLTWPVMTYCVWRDRILDAPDITTVPGTDIRYHRVAQSPTTPA